MTKIKNSDKTSSAETTNKPTASKTRTKRDIRCEKMYQYIAKFLDTHGYSPSIRDIGSGCNIQSTSTVHAYLKRLEAEGKINYSSGKRRAITLTDTPSTSSGSNLSAGKPAKPVRESKISTYSGRDDQMIRYPLIGTVTAGQPILADERIEREFVFSDDLFPTRNEVFALTVKGDSMIDDAILNEDIVLVEKCETAPYGSIVVGLVGDEATVKRLSLIDGKPYLTPANDAYSPIPFAEDDCLILGKVIGVMRTAVR